MAWCSKETLLVLIMMITMIMIYLGGDNKSWMSCYSVTGIRRLDDMVQ